MKRIDVEKYLKELVKQIEKQNNVYREEYNKNPDVFIDNWVNLQQGLQFQRNVEECIDVLEILGMFAPVIFEWVETEVNNHVHSKVHARPKDARSYFG